SAEPGCVQAGRGHQTEQPAPPVRPTSGRLLSPDLWRAVRCGDPDSDGEGMEVDAAETVDGPGERIDVPFETRVRLTLFDELAGRRIEAAEFGQELVRKELDRAEGGRALLSDHEVVGPDLCQKASNEGLDLRIGESHQVIGRGLRIDHGLIEARAQ